jgi:hypothetical protein
MFSGPIEAGAGYVIGRGGTLGDFRQVLIRNAKDRTDAVQAIDAAPEEVPYRARTVEIDLANAEQELQP